MRPAAIAVVDALIESDVILNSILPVDEGWRDWVAAGMVAGSALNGQSAGHKPATASMHAPIQNASFDDFLNAIHQVESSGRANPPDGDNGRAIGPYQIWKAYWQDAVQFDPSLGGTYQDCRNQDYAKRVVAAYLRRYAKPFLKSGNLEALARIHNGGPQGYRNPRTLGYWKKVQQHL